MKVGDSVDTPYGHGTLVGYNELSRVYHVQLSWGGKLHANKETILQSSVSDLVEKEKMAVRINAAYEALEKMRRLNLEVTCQELGISPPTSFDGCVHCLLAEATADNDHNSDATHEKKKRFHRLRKLSKHAGKPKSSKQKVVHRPCLVCGSPACPKHTSKTFRNEKVYVCLDCERLFTFDFVVSFLTMNRKERQQHVDHMIDIYDRTALLLKYSIQFMDGIASRLEDKKVVQNKASVGGSTAGVISGALGIAAVATILTPAGPPLLIASLLFGGSSTAVRSGTEIQNQYFSESHQLANNVIALYGMLKNVLRVADILRNAIARDSFTRDHWEDSQPDKEMRLSKKLVEKFKRNRGEVMAGLTAGRLGAVGMEIGNLATPVGRNSQFFSRAGSNALSAAPVAQAAGGAASAAIIVFEAHSLSKTIQAIRSGNMCEKANALRRIEMDFLSLPTTADLEEECENYLESINKRDRQMTEQEAVRLLIETAQAQAQEQATKEQLTDGTDSQSDVNGTLNMHQNDRKEKKLRPLSGNKTSNGSVLHRIRRFKGREAESTWSVDVEFPDLL